ncbi:MAG: hypothetical protein GZ093_13525 [Rhodoferax sp.]|uniref:hypothetical protein n=1 Tax=Rhodoferax sp. TaxID=50421 RepID=UPI0013FECA1A|nr:hypothetical protein [Rhodoferax sp.]NDP39751.1 hypothetical protein [Rhodoferax sp.]
MQFLIHQTATADKPPPRGLSTHILPTSATMIGVCMTVLSIGHLGAGGAWHMVIDKLLAIDALVFLASALLSFISMRLNPLSTSYEARAEVIFVAGLGLLALAAVALAFMIK